MYRKLLSGLLCAAVTVGLAASAQAQNARVFHSGKVYNIEACAGPAAPDHARCFARIVSDSAGNLLAHPAGALPAASGYAPSDLRSAYNVHGGGSSDTIIALVDAFGYANAESDLAVYRAQFGLPACTTANGCFGKYNQDGVQGNYPADNTGWAQESALDLDMASAMCPNCKIILVEGNTNSFGNLGKAENTAASLGAHVISNSYGGGESASSKKYAAAFYHHPGVAITASTGDAGYGAQFPATYNMLTAVGGTSLVKDSSARGWSETAWVDGGSGCSTVFPKMAWQHDPLCGMRMEADVSAVADPNTGVLVYGPYLGGSAWLIFGGTSVSAPLVAGIYGVNGGTVHSSADPYYHSGRLNDVTSGSNGNCGGTYFCTAGPGYDGPTGLGTPNGIAAF